LVISYLVVWTPPIGKTRES